MQKSLNQLERGRRTRNVLSLVRLFFVHFFSAPVVVLYVYIGKPPVSLYLSLTFSQPVSRKSRQKQKNVRKHYIRIYHVPTNSYHFSIQCFYVFLFIFLYLTCSHFILMLSIFAENFPTSTRCRRTCKRRHSG